MQELKLHNLPCNEDQHIVALYTVIFFLGYFWTCGTLLRKCKKPVASVQEEEDSDNPILLKIYSTIRFIGSLTLLRSY